MRIASGRCRSMAIERGCDHGRFSNWRVASGSVSAAPITSRSASKSGAIRATAYAPSVALSSRSEPFGTQGSRAGQQPLRR